MVLSTKPSIMRASSKHCRYNYCVMLLAAFAALHRSPLAPTWKIGTNMSRPALSGTACCQCYTYLITVIVDDRTLQPVCEMMKCENDVESVELG